jgi:hypothetical protein
LTDEPSSSCAKHVLYMVQRGGAHYPQIWGAPDQGVAGDGLGPCDHVLEIKTPTFSSLIFKDQN